MITDGLNPFNLLAFLALLGGTGVAAFAIGAAVIARRRELAKLFTLCLVVGWALYGGAFLAAALTSRERVLGRNEEKHLCEIDCHLAYSVVAVRAGPTVGSGAARQAARGTFYIVTVRVRFDSATISSHRGMFPIWPNPRLIEVVDDRGRSFAYSLAAERALPSAEIPPLSRALVPGESYVTDLVFDVPNDARDLRLEIASFVLPTLFVIGHENSLLHRKTTFRIDPTS